MVVKDRQWLRRTDASLVGQSLAARRGLRPGMTFDAAGITTYVAGIIRSDDPQDQNAAYAALEFVQRAGRDRTGLVTQFNVKVSDPSRLDAVASAIDEMFRTASEPTRQHGEGVHRARRRRRDQLVGARLGIGCLAAVMALIANAIVLSAEPHRRARCCRRSAGSRIASLIVAEGALLAWRAGPSHAAAAVGVWPTAIAFRRGQSIPIVAGPSLLAGVGLRGIHRRGPGARVAGLAPSHRRVLQGRVSPGPPCDGPWRSIA